MFNQFNQVDSSVQGGAEGVGRLSMESDEVTCSSSVEGERSLAAVAPPQWLPPSSSPGRRADLSLLTLTSSCNSA